MAYNVRHSKRVDHEPATGLERQAHLVREAAAWMLGLAVMLFVFWLARRYLF